MKGKKTDTSFVAAFIDKCIADGIITTDEMIARARAQIDLIEAEIQKISEKKSLRSKLLDVIETFEEKKKEDRQEEAKLLPLFSFDYPNVCQKICQRLIDPNIDYDTDGEYTYYPKEKSFDKLSGQVYTDVKTDYSTVVFCIKQLLQEKVLAKHDDLFIWGERFEEYMQLNKYGED
jgi:hypothetical protein